MNPTTDLPKLAAPAMRALQSINVVMLRDLMHFTRTEIADLHGMGPDALAKLDMALAEAGLEYKRG